MPVPTTTRVQVDGWRLAGRHMDGALPGDECEQRSGIIRTAGRPATPGPTTPSASCIARCGLPVLRSRLHLGYRPRRPARPRRRSSRGMTSAGSRRWSWRHLVSPRICEIQGARRPDRVRAATSPRRSEDPDFFTDRHDVRRPDPIDRLVAHADAAV